MARLKSVLLISFYNQKALGVKFLRKALRTAGVEVTVVFFKGFNSRKPEKCTEKELELLRLKIAEANPDIIGLSVMSSLYLETVTAVNEMIHCNFRKIIVWGGVYSTLHPKECLDHCDYVMIGESEAAFPDFVKAMSDYGNCDGMANLAYKNESGDVVINDVRPLCHDLDEIEFPDISNDGVCCIRDDSIIEGDPSIDSASFEMSASRGCPFTCSYCSSVRLLRMYSDKGRYLRFRSVENVIDELKQAKSKMPHLKFIHFWDEIFSSDETWAGEFAKEYKKHINLPFEIWSHPLMVKEPVIRMLMTAGLYKVVMGIQSGSPHVRKDIFKRNETQEQILKSCEILRKCRVPHVIYDFMLQHPFETVGDLKETYDLCMSMNLPFELQLHGLYFLPSTDIVDMALEKHIIDRDALNKIMYCSIEEHYGKYWGSTETDPESDYWFSLINLSQFRLTRNFAARLGTGDVTVKKMISVKRMNKITGPLAKIRYVYKKGILVIKSLLSG